MDNKKLWKQISKIQDQAACLYEDFNLDGELRKYAADIRNSISVFIEYLNELEEKGE